MGAATRLAVWCVTLDNSERCSGRACKGGSVHKLLVTPLALIVMSGIWPAIFGLGDNDSDDEPEARPRERSADRLHSGKWGKVFFPWKTMIVAAIAIAIAMTVVLGWF